MGLSYKFTCSEDRGSLLVLNGATTREELHRNELFPDYMRTHYKSWVKFALERFLLTLKPEEIVLVRGWVKTTEWAMAAYVDKGKSHELSFRAVAGAFANARFTVSSKEHASASAECRVGPAPAPGQENPNELNQCIFLSTYRLKRRGVLVPVIRAMSQPVDFDSRPPSPDEDEVTRTPALSPPSQASNVPVYTVSEYPLITSVR